MQLMPEVDTVKNKIQIFANELELSIEEMQVEFNKKMDAFQKSRTTLSPEAQVSQERELNDMRTRVMTRMNDAESEYVAESQRLMEPIRVKIIAAIKKVGKDNGFIYIFDTANNSTNYVIPFVNTEKAINVIDLVKSELGVKNTKN
jgi:outer membrane protein